MNQTLRHHFDHCSVQQCERLFFLDQDFNSAAASRAKMVGKLSKLKVDDRLISEAEAMHGAPSVKLNKDVQIERVVDFESHRPIKSTLRQYFNPPDVKFEETLNYRTKDHKGSIKIAPKIDICTVEGNIALEPSQDGVERVLYLDVKMRRRWFFIKWVAEHYILKSVARSYSEIQDYTQECLAKNPPG